jgi:AraC-like DNA-binding protein
VWVAHNLIELVVAADALRIILRSWRGDLIEARRRLRGPVLFVITLYAMTLSAIEIGEALGVEADWYGFADALALAVAACAGAVAFLEARPALFGVAEPAPAPAAEPDLSALRDQADLARVRGLMAAEIWREEGLAVAELARRAGMSEARLRHIIGDLLGHRNFASFINSARVEAAKARLADPAQVRTTVAAIAFDLGFASLGPFNRAFREATGVSPSEWRRRALAGAAPEAVPEDAQAPESPTRASPKS